MNEQHTCPVCSGTCRVDAGTAQYRHVYSGYDEQTNTIPCTNCGAQRMFGQPTGKVRLNKDGVPCTHSYTTKTVGRCLTEYTCVHCGERFQIDSGD